MRCPCSQRATDATLRRMSLATSRLFSPLASRTRWRLPPTMRAMLFSESTGQRYDLATGGARTQKRPAGETLQTLT